MGWGPGVDPLSLSGLPSPTHRPASRFPPTQHTPPLTPSLPHPSPFTPHLLQWVKPIGVRRKFHKYGVVLVRLLNLPPQLRNRPDKLMVWGIYNTRFAKENGGVLRMLSGVGPDGTYYDEACLRTDLEALQTGIEMEVCRSPHLTSFTPTPPHTAFVAARARGWPPVPTEWPLHGGVVPLNSHGFQRVRHSKHAHSTPSIA